MAIAVLQHFRAKPNPPEFVVPAQFGPFRDRAKYRLWTLLSEKRFGRSKLVASLAHRSFRKKYGLAAEEDITAVIDASGFAFGDQHGTRPTQQMAQNCRRWKRQGKKIILLPQAFGPFTTPAIRAACRELVENCDLVFAREEESYRHLVDVVGKRANIKRAPDFTPLVQGILPEGFQPRNGTVFVVPNMRMLDKTDRSLAERYIPFLAEAIKGVINHGLHASLLIHTPEDRALVGPIQNACGFQIDVVEESCPLRLKGILGTAYAVISSRFHALVGALSQNVPALAVGWSHKYDQLMREYGCPHCVAYTAASTGVSRWLTLIQADDSRRTLISAISRHNACLYEQIREMWADVDMLLTPGWLATG